MRERGEGADMLKLDETIDTERVLLAGIVALIKDGVSQGQDVYEALEAMPAGIHADVVEELDRIGIL